MSSHNKTILLIGSVLLLAFLTLMFSSKVPKKPKNNIQGKFVDFVLKIDSAAKDNLDELLAKTFFRVIYNFR